MRKEHDLIGERLVKKDAYYGIHTLRAIENFQISGQLMHKEIIKALAEVKKACAITNKFCKLLDENIADSIVLACDEIISGALINEFLVDSFQGGAGTSANMNANEVIANRAIEILGGIKGDYTIVHPLDHVNLSQSTNDVFPTAIKIAAIRLLKDLSEVFAELQTELQKKEEEFSDVIKVGRTQLQDAVPIFLGQEFGAYAQAISRDRWRLYKAEERLRQVNLGGTAVGTGLNAEKKYIFMVIEKLREITGIGLARTDYMMDLTQNADVFVEVSGLIKTSAVNLSKIANDLRLLSSGPMTGFGEIKLPEVQGGSSIMPGKVNPVMAEAVNQVAFQVMGNDVTITIAAQSGQLELNAFLPLIAKNLLESMELTTNVVKNFINKCIVGIEANREKCQEHLVNSFVTLTALIGHIGYEAATNVAKKCIEENKRVIDVIIEESILTRYELEKILNPYEMTSPGVPGK